MNSIDISSFASEGEAARHKVTLVYSDKAEPLVGFYIVGRGSPEFAAQEKKLRVESVLRRSVDGSLDTRTESGAERFIDISIEAEVKMATAVVVDWFGFTDKGQPAPFNRDLVHKALAARSDWRGLISKALEDEANFLPK